MFVNVLCYFCSVLVTCNRQNPDDIVCGQRTLPPDISSSLLQFRKILQEKVSFFPAESVVFNFFEDFIRKIGSKLNFELHQVLWLQTQFDLSTFTG